jgi:hypothetical protein
MSLRRTLDNVIAAIPAVLCLIAAAALHRHATAQRVAVIAAGASAALVGLARLRTALRGPMRPRRQPHGEEVRPLAQLASVERSVALAGASALEYEHRLQRDLRYAASERLRLRLGIDMQADPDAARDVIGAAAFAMVTERAAWGDRSAPAPTLAEIEALIETLERT